MTDATRLAGKRIVITRARHQAPALEALIRKYGGEPIAYPCIAIAPPANPRPLEDGLRRLDEFDWLLLTSANAARAIADCVTRLDIRLAAPRIGIAAAGPTTASEARRRLSVEVQHIPADFGAGQLARSLPLGGPSQILLPQSDIADSSTAEALRRRGAAVTAVGAYRTVIGAGGADLQAMLGRGEIDALSFTSPSAVALFRRRCPGDHALELPAACIGPATSAAARAHGFQQVVAPAQPSLSGMLALLADYFAPSAAPG